MNSPENLNQVQKRMIRRFQIMFVTFFIIVLALGGTAYYFWWRLSKVEQNPNQTASEQTRTIIEKVGRLMVLPTDEEPTIASVSDLNSLKNQPFFTHAQVGDKVLIYYKAKKAILYNPTADKIVEVAPVTEQTETPKP